RAARDAHRRDRGLPGRADGRARRARLPVRRAIVLGAPDPGGPDHHLPRAVGADARGARRGRVTPMPRRTLVACLGNIFLGDEGLGVEVARGLAREELPDGTRVTDYGIRGMHLAYDLAEGWDTTILVDAAARGGEPGTVYVIEPERRPPPDGGGQAPGLAESMLLDAHGMQPDVMLAMAGTLGAQAGPGVVVGRGPARAAG